MQLGINRYVWPTHQTLPPKQDPGTLPTNPDALPPHLLYPIPSLLLRVQPHRHGLRVRGLEQGGGGVVGEPVQDRGDVFFVRYLDYFPLRRFFGRRPDIAAIRCWRDRRRIPFVHDEGGTSDGSRGGRR